jgi:hypothetical protein
LNFKKPFFFFSELTFFLDEKSNNAYAKATAKAQKSQGDLPT